ncbi:MAG: tetratricopeptide repeat protein [Alphaproteobacteria bacterium]|nr:tetratricopeptide repeat protein [Alphaproteobacteria bacterium]
MSDGDSRAVLERALLAADQRLTAQPDAIEPRFERAGLLAALGRDEEARAEYIEVLRRDGAHFGALNDLGNLLFRTGFRTAARTVYSEAVARHPGNPVARVNLGNLLLDAGLFETARAEYEAALRADPAHPEAHQGLAMTLMELGDEAGAARHRELGFRGRFLAALPYRGTAAPVPVLLLVAADGGNIPTRLLLDDRVFGGWAVVPEFYDPATALPPHRLVFNAIGDADRSPRALEAAARLLARTDAPVINPPAAVLPTGRREISRRLADVPGAVVPKVVELPRAALLQSDAAAQLAAAGLRFPLLLRSLGFHTGRHFLRIDQAQDLADAVERLPGQNLAAIEFLDARGPDGSARKYRAMIIDGVVFPLHLAISAGWKVHYFTADMSDRPDHRAEEERFLANPASAIGARALEALQAIHRRLGLDYMGVDFGVSRGGELLVFEANATMVINPPEPDERWAYRRQPIARALEAAHAMLRRRAGAF